MHCTCSMKWLNELLSWKNYLWSKSNELYTWETKSDENPEIFYRENGFWNLVQIKLEEEEEELSVFSQLKERSVRSRSSLYLPRNLVYVSTIHERVVYVYVSPFGLWSSVKLRRRHPSFAPQNKRCTINHQSHTQPSSSSGWRQQAS